MDNQGNRFPYLAQPTATRDHAATTHITQHDPPEATVAPEYFDDLADTKEAVDA